MMMLGRRNSVITARCLLLRQNGRHSCITSQIFTTFFSPPGRLMYIYIHGLPYGVGGGCLFVCYDFLKRLPENGSPRIFWISTCISATIGLVEGRHVVELTKIENKKKFFVYSPKKNFVQSIKKKFLFYVQNTSVCQACTSLSFSF